MCENKKKLSTVHTGHVKSHEFHIVQAISFHRDFQPHSSRSIAWNRHQHRDRWPAGEAHLLAGTTSKHARGLGWPSRPDVCEAAPPSPGLFCTRKWRVAPYATDPPPCLRDQWSLGKRARRERQDAKEAHASVKVKSKQHHLQNRPRCDAAVAHHPGIPIKDDVAAAARPQQGSSPLKKISTRRCLVRGVQSACRVAPQNSEKPNRRSLVMGRNVASVRGSDVCGAISNPWEASMAASQHDVRGGSGKRAVVSITASRERRGGRERASPLAFSAPPHRHPKRKKDRTRRRHQPRRPRRRGTCSDTVEDPSSSLPDVRLKPKFSDSTTTPGEKYITTRHQVSSCATITWSPSLCFFFEHNEIK